MKTAFGIAATALLASALFGSPAIAQKGHRLAACKADIETFCASVPRGKGRVRACLTENKDKLAPECKTALEGAAPEQNQ
jgi:hypothetical protein